MSYPINYPTPQGANIQIFYGGGSRNKFTVKDWVKPQGASFVWFTLIGAGGCGATSLSRGGGSGAVTNFMGPAFLIPDVLRVSVGNGDPTQAGNDTTIVYQQNNGTGYTLLTANGGDSGEATGAGGAASTSNFFAASGFFQSIAGAPGQTNNNASTTTFLCGGSAASSGYPLANYGYGGNAGSGYFQMQPIIVGVGGGLNNSGTTGSQGGIGCGGGGGMGATSGAGGDGLVVIITW